MCGDVRDVSQKDKSVNEGEWSKESQLSWKYSECVWVGVQTHTYVCVCIYIYVYTHTCVVYCACVCVCRFSYDLLTCDNNDHPKCKFRDHAAAATSRHVALPDCRSRTCYLLFLFLFVFFFRQPKRGWHCS